MITTIAALSFSTAYGQYIVKSHSGTGQFHDHGFDGDLCTTTEQVAKAAASTDR